MYSQTPERQAIIMLKTGNSIEQLASYTDIHIVKCLSKLYHIYLVEPKKNNDIDRFIVFLKQKPEVAIAQLNHKVYLRSTIPNDTFFNKQWYLQNSQVITMDIGATAVWDSTTGGITKAGDTIVIGMVEQGLEIHHPDLKANLFINHNEIPYDNIDNDSNGYIDDYRGYNTQLNNDSMPPSDHGTGVAGVMGATGDNKIGVTGINWNIKILPVSFPNSDEATVVEAYGYYAQMKKDYIQSQGKKGAFVVAVNSSFGIDNGNPKNYPLWCAMYDSLGQLGIISVAATANTPINTDVSYDMPTNCVSHFLVMVTNHNMWGDLDNAAAYGKRSIDIAAPGTDIYTTSSNATYALDKGTSFATPQVTGSIGLLYSAACIGTINWAKEDLASGALFFKSIILNGAKKESNFTNITQCGGRLYLPSAFFLLKTGFCAFDSFPMASIYGAQAQVCVGEQTQFICLRNKYVKSVKWFVQGVLAGIGDTLRWQQDTPGFYDIQLVVSNAWQSDTLVLNKYIRVLTPPQKPIIQVKQTYLTTVQGASMNWYDTTGILQGNGVNFTPTKAGRYYCIYTNPDQCISVADAVNFYGVGIPSLNIDAIVAIYPNPTNGDLYLANKSLENLQIEILDPIGCLLFEKKWSMPQYQTQCIALADLAEGLYFVRISDPHGNIWVQKVVKN
ncbi:MAG: S8 family serine peptidase [Bacteroidota bacterium]|nr:S8 family serine peptidase [Bacteroidota bacterium]